MVLRRTFIDRYFPLGQWSTISTIYEKPKEIICWMTLVGNNKHFTMVSNIDLIYCIIVFPVNVLF